MSKFYFAWADAGETIFGSQHEVEDEIVHAFTITHNEGEIPTLSIDIKNPKIGLLNAGRKTWAWLSSTEDTTGGADALFFGRLVGVPTNLLAEIVTLTFIAKPEDYEAQKAVIADALRVLPFYDPVFVDEAHRTDSDAVLEGYSKIWHVDRVHLEVDVSDVISGEDGTLVFSEEDVPYDSVAITLEQTPLKSVSVDATVSWTQNFADSINFGSQSFRTYTGDGLISDWPRPGASLSGGWSVAASSVWDVYGIANTQMSHYEWKYTNIEKTHENGDTLTQTITRTAPIFRNAVPVLSWVTSDIVQIGYNDPFAEPPINQPAMEQTTTQYLPAWLVETSLTLAYGADRAKTERVRFTLDSNLQAILTEPSADESSELITLNGADVGIPVDDGSTAGAQAPIGDTGRRSYFPTDRGLRSLEYLISIARAHLLLRARAVKISFDVPFTSVSGSGTLTCRKNATISDPRLPGGTATGKIVAYTLSGDGNSGAFKGNITIGCAIGYGDVIAAYSGTPTYAEVDLFEAGVQVMGNDIVVFNDAADVGYSTPVDVPNDDGLIFPLTRADAVVSEGIVGSIDTQYDAINTIVRLGAVGQIELDQLTVDQQRDQAAAQTNAVMEALKANPVYYQLELIDLTGKAFETLYTPVLSLLQAPQQINLEADSSVP